MEPLAKTLAAALVAASLLASPACAQQSGNGLSNLFGGIFSGPKSDAPPQQPAVPGNTGPIPWSGEDGASGHPLMTASAIRRGRGQFQQLRRRDVAGCRTAQHLARELSSASPRG